MATARRQLCYFYIRSGNRRFGTIYSILFGVIEEDNVEQFVDVESHVAAPQNIRILFYYCSFMYRS